MNFVNLVRGHQGFGGTYVPSHRGPMAFGTYWGNGWGWGSDMRMVLDQLPFEHFHIWVRDYCDTGLDIKTGLWGSKPWFKVNCPLHAIYLTKQITGDRAEFYLVPKVEMG